MRGLPVPFLSVIGSCVLLLGACGGSGVTRKVGPEAGVGGGGGLPGTDAGAGGSGGASPVGTGGSGTGGSTPGTGGHTPIGGADGGAASGGVGGSYDGAVDQLRPIDLAADGPKDIAQLLDSPIDQGESPSCGGKPDFTPCAVTTTPDRKYDICVGGACVSPGCGDETCNPPGPHFVLADSGQRTCAGNAQAMTCPAEGAAYFGQDAQYGWDSKHAAKERFSRTSAEQPVVSDTVTGLNWQGCAAGLGGNDCATGTVTLQSWQDALAYCDGLSWGGYQDWHLPDIFELDTLSDADATLDATAFPAAVQSGKSYWSSSTVAGHATLAWTDYRGAGLDKTYTERVRCVRGQGVSPASRFVKDAASANQPMVVDKITGLTWQGCVGSSAGADCATGTSDPSPWADALAYCENLTWAGQTDWRLPNWKELRSIVNTQKASPAIDASLFPATPFAAPYWTSTSGMCAGTACYAWYVSFTDGQANASSPKISGAYVRCVRGGQ
jgi:hypothetical protein